MDAVAAGAPAAPVRGALPWRGFLLDCLIVAALLIGLTLVLVVPIVMFKVAGAPNAGATAAIEAALPAITAAAIVAMLLTALAVWWLRGRSLPGTLPRMAALPAYGLAVVAGLAIQGGSQAFARLAAQVGAGFEPSNVEPVTALLASAPVLAWLLIVIVGPFAEELLLRHVLLRRFAVAGHRVAGLLLTSIAFALMHEPAPSGSGVGVWLGGLFLYTAMGVGFGLVYLRTGRFRAAFLAHAACNAAALALAAYSAS